MTARHGLLLPTVVAHRGASAFAPENTLAAFRLAHAEGATWIEFDVRLSRCGTPIVLHDATLARTTDGRGRAADLDLAALHRLDAGRWFGTAFAGERVPTLGATLDLAAELGLGCNVEIKAERPASARGTVDAALPLLLGAPGAVLVSSFSRPALERLASAADLALGVLVGRRILGRDLDLARAIGAVSLHADWRAFGAPACRRTQDAGLATVAYTVNQPAVARRLHRDLGVGTLITDRPGAILGALGLQA